MKRLAEFVRSVIPADPFQLLFLGGVVCLLAAHGLPWQPSGVAFRDQSSEYFRQLVWYMGPFSVYFIIFSAMTGYYVCFWPGIHPVRRVIWLVCGPALLGLGLMFVRILYLSTTPLSVLESAASVFGQELRVAKATLLKLPAGFQVTLLGLVLIGIFTSRLALGIATLPVTLPTSGLSQEDSEAWRHLELLLFVLVGPLFLVGVLLSLVGIGIPLIIFSGLPAYIQSIWFSRLATVLETAAACVVVLCLMGRENRQTVHASIQRPDRISVLLALTIPVGTGVLMSAGHFLVDRALWAARDFTRLSPPEFRSYVNVPDPYLLLLFFAAFLEEMIFRGLLQKRFIQRYGLSRGIFFVGVVWAAFHFFSDFSGSRATEFAVLAYVGMRMVTCVTLSFVLGWLTLYSRSVIPAAVAHALYNILVFSGFGPSFAGKDVVRVSLWAVVAWALFRYWPVKVEESPQPPQPRFGVLT